MVMLKTDNEIGLDEIKTRQTYSGTGDDYLANRNEYYDTTTNDAISRISERNRPKAQLFFEQRKGPFMESAAKFGGQIRQDTLSSTIGEAVDSEYQKLAAIPPDQVEQKLPEVLAGVDAIIKSAPLPDRIKNDIALEAARRALQVLPPDVALGLIEKAPQALGQGKGPLGFPQIQTEPPQQQLQIEGPPGQTAPPLPQPKPVGSQSSLEQPLAPVSAAANAGKAGLLGAPGQNLTTITTASGARFTVNRAVAANFQGFLNELEASGYNVDAKQSGGYNYRKIAGSRSLSEHAYGNAIDINWNDNARGAKGNLPKNVAQIAAKYGLTWGGNWKHRDAMHFEWNPAHKVAAGGPFAKGGPTFASAQAAGKLNPTLTAYSPQRSGSAVEGSYAAAGKGPNGRPEVMTLADVAAGRSDYVTLAGDKTQFGKTYIIPEITYRDANGALITLKNVKGVVHDTGSAFRGRGTSRFDIPVARDLPQSEINKQPFSQQKIALVPAGQNGQGTQLASAEHLGASVQQPPRAPNTIPVAQNGPQQGQPQEIQVADASGRILPSEIQVAQTYRPVESQLRDLLIQHYGALKRAEQAAIDKAEREQQQKIKEEQRAARDEGLTLLIDGKLTDAWVHDNAARLSAGDAYTLLTRLHKWEGTSRLTDPKAYSDRLLAIDADPQKALEDARNDLAEGRISVSDYRDIDRRVAHALSLAKQGKKLPDWASRLKGEFFEQTGTHQGDSWKRISRSQDAMKEFTDYLNAQMDAGTLDYEKAKKRMHEGIIEYKTGRALQKRGELPPIPRKWTSATPDTMTFEELQAAKGRLIQKLQEELAGAGDDAAAKREILKRYQQDGKILQAWDKVLKEQADATGEKLKLAPKAPATLPGMMKLGGPKPQEQAQGAGTNANGQPQSPGDYLKGKDYTDKLPPVATPKVMTPSMNKEYMNALMVKFEAFRAQGYSHDEALTRAENDPEIRALWRRSLEAAPTEVPSGMQPLLNQ